MNDTITYMTRQEMANTLGISRNTLRKKMKELGIKTPARQLLPSWIIDKINQMEIKKYGLNLSESKSGGSER